jgi:hypothetical protein
VTRAEQLLKSNHLATAGQVRKLAQKLCAGMTRDHRKNKDVYMFTDGSRIVVCKNAVSLEFSAKAGV